MIDTSFQKKTLYASITGVFLGLILLGCPFFIFASENYYFQDFDSLSIGDLNGQDSWVATYTNVSSAYSYSASHSVKKYRSVQGGDSDFASLSYRDIADLDEDDKYISFYYYPKEINTGTNVCNLSVSIGFDLGTPTYIGVRPTATGFGVLTMGASNCTDGTETEIISENNWYLIEILFDFDTDTMKSRVDGGEWSATRSISGTATNIDRFSDNLYSRNQEYYIDDLDVGVAGTGDCGINFCYKCGTSEDCLASGVCLWEYAGAGEYECHMPYIAYVYGCGLGECGCPDQTTCESAEPLGTCEWVDRGYGYGCYETLEAPPEAQWEMPEVEDCDELSGVEKWLCEIRNFFTGLFMPTQEKVDNLKKTLGNFKAKFPFNYIGAVNSFFTTLKTSLDTEKSIPVKVLGVESNVNFSFWDQTTTIGGTSETFKNILFDFTTAIIIIAFLFWIISFIKRIF